MSLQQILYTVSVLFQLSGALILIFFCWGKTEHKMLKTIFPANVSMKRNENNKVIISKKNLRKAYTEVWLNRIAFIFLGLGYGINIFSNSEGIVPWIGFLIVVLGSIILMYFGNIIANSIAKKHSKCDAEYDFKELCLILNTDVVTNITNKEIDQFETLT